MLAKIYNMRLTAGILVLSLMIFANGLGEDMDGTKSENVIELPQAKTESKMSIESTILNRRSIRRYTEEPLNLAEVSRLLWAAQGITDARGFRTSPSAGALYPLEIYVVVGNVLGLSPGIYKYEPNGHRLFEIVEGDKREELCRAALNQGSIKNAPMVMVFSAVYRRTTSKYGQRGVRYVFIETGHSAQNVCLQAVALGLGTVTIGAFHDEQVQKIVGCGPNEEPLYLLPIGRKNKKQRSI